MQIHPDLSLNRTFISSNRSVSQKKVWPNGKNTAKLPLFGSDNKAPGNKNWFNQILTHLKQLNDDYSKKANQAEVLTNFMWNQFALPSITDNPENTKAFIAEWEESIIKEGTPGVLRDSVLKIMQYFKQNIDKPENIKNSLHLFNLFNLYGGHTKIKDIAKLLLTNSFMQASPVKQGQLIMEEMGPIFVKAFQTLNTIPNMFSPAVQNSMVQLYDNVSVEPFQNISNTIESELGMPVEKAFAWFNPIAVKAGSIAQVHEAKLHNGKKVAVKIVRKNTADNMDQNLKLLKPLSLLFTQLYPQLDAARFLEDFTLRFKQECDMLGEAERLKTAHKILKDKDKALVPEVIDSHTTKQILTMQFLEVENLLKHQGNRSIAKRYLKLIAQMLFQSGVCSGDPLPANITYNSAEQKFCFLDAGLVDFIAEKDRIAFAKLLVALALQDPNLLAEVIIPINSITDVKVFQDFKNSLKALFPKKKQLDQKSVLSAYNQAINMAKEQGFKVTNVNPLLWKTLFTALNVTKTLYADLNADRLMGNQILHFLIQHDKNFLIRAGYIKLANSFKSLFAT